MSNKFDVPVTPEIETCWQNWHAFNLENCSMDALNRAVDQDGWHRVFGAAWLEDRDGNVTDTFRIWSNNHIKEIHPRYGKVYVSRHADFRGELADILERATRGHDTYSEDIMAATLFVVPNPWRLVVTDGEKVDRVIRLDGVANG